MSIKPAGLPASHFEKLEKHNPDFVKDLLIYSRVPWAELVETLNDENYAYDWRIRELMLTQYIRSGKKHFHVNDDLTWLLSQTRAEIMVDHIMPFECVYLSFEGNLDCSADGKKVEGVYVSKNEKPREPGEANSKIVMDFILCFGVDASMHYQHVVTTGENIEYGDWIHKFEDRTGTVARQAVVDIISLTINALLYISTPNSVKYKPSQLLTDKQKKRVKKSRRRLGQLEKLDQNVIILGPEPGAAGIARAPHKGGTVRSHLRRGHWRRQWVGSRVDEFGNPRQGEKQVPRWVLPTWVVGAGEPAEKTKYIVR